MIRLLLILICFLPGISGGGEGDWELKKAKDGIRVSTRSPENSNIKEYRASALINASLENVYRFLSDLEGRPDWVINCVGLEILDTADGKIIYHTGYDIPWPMADRDLVVEAELKMIPDSGYATLRAWHVDYDYPPAEGVIRMTDYLEDVRLESTPGGKTLYSAQGFADPAGKVPAWIVNMFLVDGIFDSVVKTREMAEK